MALFGDGSLPEPFSPIASIGQRLEVVDVQNIYFTTHHGRDTPVHLRSGIPPAHLVTPVCSNDKQRRSLVGAYLLLLPRKSCASESVAAQRQ